MNKILKVVACIALLTSSLGASSDTKKTELILRDHRYRAALFSTFHKLKAKDDCQSKFQFMGFYNETTDGKKLGEVFAANCKNYVTIGTAAQAAAGTADVENNLLLHKTTTPAINTLAGRISFDPKQTTYGTIFQAYIKFDNILKGLYLTENLAILKVKHNLNMKICDNATGAYATEAHSIADILSAKDLLRDNSGTTNENEQEALRYAKICGSHDRTGINNMESILGWNFLRKKSCKVGVHVALQTPTGDRPTGEWLWEPRLGNRHWGLGAGLKAKCKLWKSGDSSLKFFWVFDYRYQFEETEKRTLGIKNVLTAENYTNHILSHYYLLGKVGKFGLTHAANVLTMNVDVEPGSNIDTFAGLNFNWGKFILDLGYNFFWKEEEKVSMGSSCSWTDGVYAIGRDIFATCDGAFELATDSRPLNTAINTCNIDTCVAQTPSILSHTVFGGVGYVFEDWERPLMLGFGGSYEFGDDRAAADSFTIWAKAGFAF
ncbi:hypothetical protein KKA53_04130 [Candidatus Dependentiae bacterium]|nr:hypothetical protein [Candidatus Dependentiae bacterium]